MALTLWTKTQEDSGTAIPVSQGEEPVAVEISGHRE